MSREGRRWVCVAEWSQRDVRGYITVLWESGDVRGFAAPAFPKSLT